MRIRKTRDIWDVRGDYGQGFETVTAALTRSEALSLLRDYRTNEPGVAFKVVKTREKIES